jgi:hypothetical protein
MKRRLFIKASVAGGALAFPGASLLAARVVVARPPEDLNKLFADEAKIRQLGRNYLAAFPGEDDIDILQNLAVPVENLSLATAAVKQDFDNGDVVTVDGWVLSRTEARHCALYSMQSARVS